MIVLNTAQAEFCSPDFAALRRKGLLAVLDRRNAWDPAAVRATGLIHARPRGVATRRGVMCAHVEPPYRDHPGTWRVPEGQNLHYGEVALNRCILLPMYHDLTDAEARQVCRTRSDALRARLNPR